MKREILIIVIILFCTSVIKSQDTINYNDVAIIVNDNSPLSLEIAEYFKLKRNIPELNIIHISAPNQEEVDTVIARDMLNQIERKLDSLDISTSINYIVTTKGTPYKVYFGEDDSYYNSSFESELCLLKSRKSDIFSSNGESNPYFNTYQDFSSTEFGVYLVTRLDGYTKQDIFNLIDRSGQNLPINQNTSMSVFDISGVSLSMLGYYTPWMEKAIDTLNIHNWNNIIYNTDSLIITDVNKVITYSSINFTPSGVVLDNQWLKGSVAELLSGKSAKTFLLTENINNDLIVANIISEGVTGANGYVYDLYLSRAIKTEILYSCYLDTISNYNLAESYFMATPFLSYVNLVIGDPKTSIIIDNTLNIEEVNNNNIEIYPNPTSDIVFIKHNDKLIKSIRLYNKLGQLLFIENDCNNLIDLSRLDDGVYVIIIEFENSFLRKKVIVRN